MQSSITPEHIILGAFLHDLGKVITNYLNEHPHFKEIINRYSGVKYKHALIGADLLREYGFPDSVISVVVNHHEIIDQHLALPNEICNVIKAADHLDASHRERIESDTIKGRLISMLKQ